MSYLGGIISQLSFWVIFVKCSNELELFEPSSKDCVCSLSLEWSGTLATAGSEN